jgi:hypothetical protein
MNTLPPFIPRSFESGNKVWRTEVLQQDLVDQGLALFEFRPSRDEEPISWSFGLVVAATEKRAKELIAGLIVYSFPTNRRRKGAVQTVANSVSAVQVEYEGALPTTEKTQWYSGWILGTGMNQRGVLTFRSKTTGKTNRRQFTIEDFVARIKHAQFETKLRPPPSEAWQYYPGARARLE